MDIIDDLLTRGVANIIPGKETLHQALSARKLNIFLGIDPTSTHIHLGHAFPLRKLQQFLWKNDKLLLVNLYTTEDISLSNPSLSPHG